MSEKMQERLERVHKDIVFLANEVEDALFKAVKALKKQDTELAQKVKEDDWKINRQEVNIEKQILEILALQQPVAVDLRFLIVALKMMDKSGLNQLPVMENGKLLGVLSRKSLVAFLGNLNKE